MMLGEKTEPKTVHAKLIAMKKKHRARNIGENWERTGRVTDQLNT